MLDHMTFRVTDIGRAKAFYSAALAPLGYSLSFEGNYGANMLGFSCPDASEPDGQLPGTGETSPLRREPSATGRGYLHPASHPADPA